MKKYIIIFSIVFILGIIADMLTKYFLMEQSFVVIDGLLSFYPTWNTGAGWSILSDQTLFLTIFSAIILIGVIIANVFYHPKSKWYAVTMGFIFAGAVGNLFDRVFFGAVRDFIKLDFIEFPIFNIADSCLTVGAIMLCIYVLFFTSKKEEKK